MSFTDHEAPVIACPGNQTAYTEPGQASATVGFADPRVTDNSGEHLTITCDAESGSQFKIGETNVTCQAEDPSGNLASCSFTVNIEGK